MHVVPSRNRLFARAALVALALLAFSFAGAACGVGGGDDEEEGTPPARTQQEYAQRLLPYLRKMNRNQEILNGLQRPEIQIYLYGRNETTIRTLDNALEDLERCTDRLSRVGEPPARIAPLVRVHNEFGQACQHYEHLSEVLQEWLPLAISDDPDERRKGSEVLKDSQEPSRLAAEHYGRALEILAERKVMESAGFELNPSG